MSSNEGSKNDENGKESEPKKTTLNESTLNESTTTTINESTVSSPTIEKKIIKSELLTILHFIIEFTQSSKDFTKMCCVCKHLYEYMTDTNTECCKNVVFHLSSKKNLKSVRKFVYNLSIVKEYIVFKSFRFFKYFPNVTSFEVKHQFYFNGSELKYFSNLEKLKIKWCDEFDGEKIGHIKVKLKTLIIYENSSVTDQIFTGFRESLKKLKIIKCKNVTDEGVKELKLLKELKVTNLRTLSDDCFENLKKMEKLFIKWCENIKGNKIKNLIHLTCLTLWNCDNVVDEIFENLKKLKCLKVLFCKNVEGKKISFDNLKELRIANNEKLVNDIIKLNLKNLEILDIKKCRLVTNEAFDAEKTHLVLLKLYGFVTINDDIFTNMNNLEKLDIEYCSKIQGSNFKNLHKLKSLVLKEGFASNTIKFFCNVEDSIFNFLPNLESLNLSCTKKIMGVEENFGKLKNLRKLIVVDNDNISDKIFLNLKQLEMLDLKRCKNVDGKELFNLPNLIKLKIKSCEKINKPLQKEIKKYVKGNNKKMKTKK